MVLAVPTSGAFVEYARVLVFCDNKFLPATAVHLDYLLE